MPIALGVEAIVSDYERIAVLLVVDKIILTVIERRTSVRKHVAFLFCTQVAEVGSGGGIKCHESVLLACRRPSIGIIHIAP